MLIGCDAEKQNRPVESSLNIVSNYLEAKDSLLFSGFQKKFKVKVKIYNMKTDQLIGHFRNHGFNSKFDLIMVSSLHDIQKLSKQNILHPIEHYLNEEEQKSKFNSAKYSFVGFGIDPYVFSYHKDSSIHARTYADLQTQVFYSMLSDEQTVPLLASIMPKFQKAGTYEWIKKFERNRKNSIAREDSLRVKVCLTTLSLHESMLSDKAYKEAFASYFIPNQRGEGAFYNLKTFAIVYQAEHFTQASQLIHYYLKKSTNTSLNKQLGTLSIFQENEMRLYRIKSDELIQYYSMIERIMNKVRS